MVTAHDPHDDPLRAKAKLDERAHINQVRANCIRMLRAELGPQFYGGFRHNPYTVKSYKDVLLDDPRNARKQRYLEIVQQFPICIATTGLHGSIGGKFGEYVALSKAIVSEKLQYEVPGTLQSERNYLEFSSPERCVEQSMRLINDEQLRMNLMLNNSYYYQNFLRPDMLVFNAIAIAMHKPAFRALK